MLPDRWIVRCADRAALVAGARLRRRPRARRNDTTGP